MALGGLFLSWCRPSADEQKSCIAAAGAFNYAPEFHAASPFDDQNRALSDKGFSINRARVLLGSGAATFAAARAALESWTHFQLSWAFVDSNTPVKAGTRFCVCAKELPFWIMMPLQIAYVNGGSESDGRQKRVFGFGSGTLHGHLLAGEERFSVQWDESDRVWYEIFSFSKPAHLLSFIAYPYVQLRQKLFARQSTQAILKHLTAQQGKA